MIERMDYDSEEAFIQAQQNELEQEDHWRQQQEQEEHQQFDGADLVIPPIDKDVEIIDIFIDGQKSWYHFSSKEKYYIHYNKITGKILRKLGVVK